MSVDAAASNGRPYWFVGASYGGTEDQTKRFLSEGVWENGYEDRYREEVNSIQPGDRIAIKSTFTRKHNLPFDNRGEPVSTMAIKAVGTVRQNLQNGRTLRVEWTPFDPPRDWYFYTNRLTVWKVMTGNWQADALIDFAFNDKLQDYDTFRNAPYWRERYGDALTPEQRFPWTVFYQELADHLLAYRNNRDGLLAGLYDIAGRVEGLSYLQDRFADGSTGPLRDICPFTVIGTFNRNTKDARRVQIATALAEFLGVESEVPTTFDGIPTLDSRFSLFFRYERERQPDDIEGLWQLFEAGIAYADEGEAETKDRFCASYDSASQKPDTGWSLTMGLYWIRPWHFQTLDSRSRKYLGDYLHVSFDTNGADGRCTGEDLLRLCDDLASRFEEERFPVNSFPELSLAGWQTRVNPPVAAEESEADSYGNDQSSGENLHRERPPGPEPYTLDNIVSEGCFLSRARLSLILERLQTKKNVILQGPPGTGKTWLAKRLAYALMGQKAIDRLRAVQFHPNLSYEDFIRGWRPSGEGTLQLMDGPLMEMVDEALNNPNNEYVLVIEEINRGNPAQIFGEMLTLLEADKRNAESALALSYTRDKKERVHIPQNLYLVGTMNIADRSLALVDLALRRRFAFVDLEPEIGNTWRDWLASQFGFEAGLIDQVQQRILALNETIASDNSLGTQFRIGHSYLTPPQGAVIGDPRGWFQHVVETEIGPLLEEYWFDQIDHARKHRDLLLKDL